MMFKKIIILPLFFVVATIISISCGNNSCKEYAGKQFTSLKNGKIAVQTNNGFITDNQIVTADSVILQVGYARDCVAKNKSNPFSLFNSAYATDCACGDKGFKKQLTKLVFTASQNFNGIAAGQPINNFVKVYINNYFSSSSSSQQIVTPTAFVDSINARNVRNSYLDNNAISFQASIPQKPAPAFTGTITANYIFINTDTVKASTVNFTWQ